MWQPKVEYLLQDYSFSTYVKVSGIQWRRSRSPQLQARSSCWLLLLLRYYSIIIHLLLHYRIPLPCSFIFVLYNVVCTIIQRNMLSLSYFISVFETSHILICKLIWLIQPQQCIILLGRWNYFCGFIILEWFSWFYTIYDSYVVKVPQNFWKFYCFIFKQSQES